MMSPKHVALCAISIGTLTAATSGGDSEKVGSAEVETLARSSTSWDGKPYVAYPTGQPELTVLKLTIPANTVLPWHRHPIPNAAYVLSGEITVEDAAGLKRRSFVAGQAFTESVDEVHHGRTGPAPVILVVTYAGTAATPTSVPEKGQRAEY
jgi:quercetin dioxygenase-like cupin family protein